MGGKRKTLLHIEVSWNERRSDSGLGVKRLVDACDLPEWYWLGLCAVEHACKKLRNPVFRQTVRTVYRVVALERCAEEEQRPLILRLLRVDKWAYYKRIDKIIRILTHSRRR